MKLLTVAIPCYNSESYMEHCINTLLTGGEEVEIIIVDDGSAKDRTGEIADRYAREYPTICRAIHQENGGHGEAVNTGLKNATGIFFKVVDSDDWVNEEAYEQVLATLRRFVYGGETLDMLVTNFVYEKEGARRKKVMKYHTAFPKDKVFGWNDVKFFHDRAVYTDALCYLQDRAAYPVRSGASQTHLLCGQYFCVPAPASCEAYLLPGCEFLPLLHRKAGPVRQRRGDDWPH